MSTDWATWHEQYGDSSTGLPDRLAAVRSCIHRHLDATAPAPVRVVSACAGDGRDLLGALAHRTDAERVTALLVESDGELAGRAIAAAAALPSQAVVLNADAGVSDTYADAGRADLLLLCGIFGNISDADVRATVAVARQLCDAGAAVVWTRHRAEPDLTPAIRRWFEEAGFSEDAFLAPEGAMWSVGMHRLSAEPEPLLAGQRWFTFLR